MDTISSTYTLQDVQALIQTHALQGGLEELFQNNTGLKTASNFRQTNVDRSIKGRRNGANKQEGKINRKEGRKTAKKHKESRGNKKNERYKGINR